MAVLIDADNVSATVIEDLLTEVARFGEATVKRIYGDFTSPQSSSWKQCLNKYAIKPIQQFAYTKGKNATDSALIIDAMDLLYTRRFDGFCLVSSDSDFTGLATRIREEGILVFGFGESKTPEAFRNACHKFILTEILSPVAIKIDEVEKNIIKKDNKSTEEIANNEPDRSKELPLGFILDALEKSSDDAGWAHLGTFGSFLTKLKPDFDVRVYGFKKLSDLIKKRNNLFQIEERLSEGSSQKNLYVRAIKK